MADKPLLITGIPRSGTTLLTALADCQPDSVALNEPRWQFQWAESNLQTSGPEDFARWLVGDCAVIRRRLLDGVPIPERRLPDGSAVTNYYRLTPQQENARPEFQVIPFTRPGLSPDFRLAVKHNGLYLSALPQLIETQAFTILAVVRHPVGVLASWNAVPIPLGEGKMPGALYWKNMMALTASPMELLEKQVRMYDLACKRLLAARPQIHLLRYEDIMADPRILAPAFGAAPRVPEGMITPRKLEFYGPDSERFAEAVWRHGHYYREFYPA